MKKLLSIVALCTLMVLGFIEPSDATEPETQVDTPVCVGEITGPGTATTNGNCVLVVYEYADGAPGPDQYGTSLPQDLFDTDGDGETLEVSLPACFYQVDLLDASVVLQNPLSEPNYYGSNGWLVDYDHGGTAACVTTTTTTVPETTTTTVPETTTTVPETTTVPSLVTTVPTPPTNELARTGTGTDNLAWFVLGFAITGGALVYLGESYRKEYTS